MTPTPVPTTLAIFDNGTTPSETIWFDTAGAWSSTTAPAALEDIAYDHNGVLYGGEASTGAPTRIWAYSGGSWSTFWSSASYQYMYGLTADASGNLWAVADVNGTVCDLLKINISTKATTVVVSHTSFIYGLAAYGNNIWGGFNNGGAGSAATQYQGGTGSFSAPNIWGLALTGASSGIWSDNTTNVVNFMGGAATGSGWSYPNYMCSDTAGNVYVANANTANVAVYNGSTWSNVTHGGIVAAYAVAVSSAP